MHAAQGDRRDWETGGGAQGLRVERRGEIALLTIYRPQARNSLTMAGHEELVRRWELVQRDPDLRALVVTGAEDPSLPPEKQAFCAGADMTELTAGSLPGAGDTIPTLVAIERQVPVIAAVNGHCIGAGVGIALAADLRVASPTATFGLPEVSFGTVPGNGSVRRALLELPRAVAMELLLLPGRMDAHRALEVGLVNSLVPPGDVLATALEWAETIAALPREAVRAAMKLVARAPGLPPSEAARLEGATIAELALTTSSAGLG
jgi:enoyl-CoA hydratase/carnithine racemase